jgi:type IV pilus assembly protein PilQ
MKRNRQSSLLWVGRVVAALLCGWALTAVGQETAPVADAPQAEAAAPAPLPAPTAEPEPAEPIGEPEAPKGVVQPSGKGDLINVAVDNETLENVVNMFTRITGANIVATATNLGGTVTVNLKDVEWKAALSSILQLHQLALAETMPGSGVYSIVPKPPIEEQPLVVETLFLKHISAVELRPVLMNTLAAVTNATMTELSSRNALVVRTTEPNLRELKKMVETMDIPSKQVCVETKFVELDESASKQLGIRWDSLSEFGVRLGVGPFTYDRNTTKNKQSSDERTTEDSKSRSDTTTRAFLSDGTEYDRVVIQQRESPPGSGNFIEETITLPTRELNTRDSSQEQHKTRDFEDFSRVIEESQAAILNMDTLNVVLSALKKTEGVQVISNPKILVTSGSTNAWFSVGGREPIIKVERKEGTQDSPGDKITAQLDTEIDTEYIKEGYLNTGIQLKVLPVVKTDSMIESIIEPKLVRLAGYTSQIEGNKWPIIDVKEISTKFTLASGQTVAIGGLTDTRDDKKTSKVPLLGDIPLIGKYLFSHTADVKSQTETIIFVTLSLADPLNLRDDAGMPSNAELVHKNQIRAKIRQQELAEEIKQLEQAVEQERARKSRSKMIRGRN